MQPDRTIQPATTKIGFEHFDLPQSTTLDNGIPVYLVRGGVQELVRIEFVFNAGSWQQEHPLQARFTCKMLIEGAAGKNSSDIADILEFHGAKLATSPQKDTSIVTLSMLNKHADHLLPLLHEIITQPSFPEHDLIVLKEKHRQQFILEMSKVGDIALYRFSEALFGRKHPYGKMLSVDDFGSFERAWLLAFYQTHYRWNNCKILISGRFNEEVISSVNTLFGTSEWNSSTTEAIVDIQPDPLPGKRHFFDRTDAVQSAIRIGMHTIGKTHKDFPNLLFLSTLLGGYFGSRLTTNIREDKGYTYGIYSATIPFLRGSMFFIASEVMAEVCQKAIDEVYIEINNLREKEVPAPEIDRVRNYMFGSLQRSIDGPFQIADRLRNIIEFGLDYKEYTENYIRSISDINGEKILKLSNEYLDPQRMIEVVVGKE